MGDGEGGVEATAPQSPCVKNGSSVFAAHAKAATHDLRRDSTHAFSSVYRETCPRCGASALAYRSNQYGSALERTCDEQLAHSKRVAEILR